MATVETLTFEQLTAHIRKLTPDEQLRLVEVIVDHVRDQMRPPIAPTEQWTDEELEELLSGPTTPLNTQEIMETGLFGAWSDMGIEDGQAFVDDLRRARPERNQW